MGRNRMTNDPASAAHFNHRFDDVEGAIHDHAEKDDIAHARVSSILGMEAGGPSIAVRLALIEQSMENARTDRKQTRGMLLAVFVAVVPGLCKVIIDWLRAK